MEHQFMLDNKMALFVAVEGKYVLIYFHNIDPKTKEAYGHGLKLILLQYGILGRNVNIIQKTLSHGCQCSINLGYMLVESDKVT
uniref:Uncharacterized protein n=1 Tax=Romanomermis culicivorax TaxID=13658 RepID=A0A915I224_ROMCU